MVSNPQSRKWMLTINNPQDCGLDRDGILKILNLFCPDYYCMADETATTGTFHTHIFIYSKSPIRFSTVKNRFPTAHIEKAFGNAKDNRDYIRKEGKWANDKKSETSHKDSFYEFGKIPNECEERDPKMYKLLCNVKDGLSTTEIIDETPSFVCRITDYNGKNGVRFDSYHGQDILVFEEFNSQIPIEAMLNYLDIYPLTLPARYSDRTACYTKVYITSNLPLSEQYINVKHNHPETWKAFIRRIHRVFFYKTGGETEEIYFK